MAKFDIRRVSAPFVMAYVKWLSPVLVMVGVLIFCIVFFGFVIDERRAADDTSAAELSRLSASAEAWESKLESLGGDANEGEAASLDAARLARDAAAIPGAVSAVVAVDANDEGALSQVAQSLGAKGQEGQSQVSEAATTIQRAYGRRDAPEVVVDGVWCTGSTGDAYQWAFCARLLGAGKMETQETDESGRPVEVEADRPFGGSCSFDAEGNLETLTVTMGSPAREVDCG